MERRSVSIEDLRQMEDDLWTARDEYDLRRYVDSNHRLNRDGQKRSRQIHRAAEITGYNFTVRLSKYGNFIDCVCQDCGHRLSFNNQTGSWARKHRAKHLGVSKYDVWVSGVDILERR